MGVSLGATRQGGQFEVQLGDCDFCQESQLGSAECPGSPVAPFCSFGVLGSLLNQPTTTRGHPNCNMVAALALPPKL